MEDSRPSTLSRIDRVLAPVTWVAAALVVLLLFVGPSLVGADKPAAAAPAGAKAAAPASGAAVFASAGCGGCHTFKAAGTNGTVGPDLDKLATYAKTANQGSLEDFTQESIANPSAYIEKGYSNAMPNFGSTLSAKQIADLVAYVTENQG